MTRTENRLGIVCPLNEPVETDSSSHRPTKAARALLALTYQSRPLLSVVFPAGPGKRVRGNLSVVDSRRLKAGLVGAPIVANGRAVVRLFEPTADEEPVAACSICLPYLAAKSFSNNSSESLAPFSDNHTDLFFVAGSEI